MAETLIGTNLSEGKTVSQTENANVFVYDYLQAFNPDSGMDKSSLDQDFQKKQNEVIYGDHPEVIGWILAGIFLAFYLTRKKR